MESFGSEIFCKQWILSYALSFKSPLTKFAFFVAFLFKNDIFYLFIIITQELWGVFDYLVSKIKFTNVGFQCKCKIK